MKELNQKLAQIQTKFKSKKSRYNSFGKYYFRSAEDILEATKPFLLDLGVSVTINERLCSFDAGSPVMSALDGIVTHKGPKFGNHGGYVVVNDVDAEGNKLSTANLYGHVKNVQVEIGDKVKQGDHLADIIYYPADPAYGKAGTDHSHLHFERFTFRPEIL